MDSSQQYQLQLITALADSLPTANSNGYHIMSRWIQFLPERFGRSKALDAAIASFTTQQIGTSFGDKQMLRYGSKAYVKALACLQKSLNDPVEAITSETQCAAMLLCIYEVFSLLTISVFIMSLTPRLSYSQVPPLLILG